MRSGLSFPNRDDHSGEGCTREGMKTAVSIPDSVLHEVERLARRTKKSRSRLFTDALREYLARHGNNDVTDAMNRVCAELAETDLKDEFVALAARRTLVRIER
jgi:metal-responsive CopG/Arc/MetJ family transcriptional regulator